jgi:hypothetical protein
MKLTNNSYFDGVEEVPKTNMFNCEGHLYFFILGAEAMYFVS